MIESRKLKNKDEYLHKLIAFQDTEPVKVVTGIRRCGKSGLLRLMAIHWKDTWIPEERILSMNFESHRCKNMHSDAFYEYVKQRIVPHQRMYLFSMKCSDNYEKSFFLCNPA